MKFSEFNPKDILCDIERGITEEIHVKDYHNFIGDKSSVEGKSIGNGLFDHGDDTYSFNNGTTKVKFKSLDAAETYSNAKRNKFKKSLMSAHDEMTSDYKIDEEDSPILKKYTDHLGSLNHKLLNKETLTSKESSLVDDLDKTIAKHKAKQSLILYTGTNGKHSEQLRKNDVVNHPSFLSTSLSPNSARAFAEQKGGDIIKIHVSEGHPSVYASGSGYEGEREVILPRNVKLKIHKDKEQTLIHEDSEYVVHHATIEE